MTSAILGPEWRAGEDGRFHRSAARVLLLDAGGRVLLVRGHDRDADGTAGSSWWITVGGGVADGEDACVAAVREVFEETGLSVRAEQLVGPVLRRTAEFEFLGERVCQDEQFFLARIDAVEPGGLSDLGWTDIERAHLDELRWWQVAELAVADAVVYPAQLPALLTELAAGWDGTVRELGTGP